MSADSIDEDWWGPCSYCTMSRYYRCGLEAVEMESNDNCHRRYARCAKRVVCISNCVHIFAVCVPCGLNRNVWETITPMGT